jgi:hypothetical protein
MSNSHLIILGLLGPVLPVICDLADVVPLSRRQVLVFLSPMYFTGVPLI